MAKKTSAAESWQQVYEAFSNINFSSFTYDSVKQSIIQYLQLYFPEYNNFIESDELISIIETFAYICEELSYRIDVASHENFISVAQRQDSILRLAKLISYNPSRNLPARGLVKITSVTTTQTIFDTHGNNLTNLKINWNDVSNPLWKDQFLTVLNASLVNDFGSLSPSNRVQVNNEVYEIYTLNNSPLVNNVVPYSTYISGATLNMELVSSLLDQNGPYEVRPQANANFNIIYASDGLGDSSQFTGFFILTKQGTLSSNTTQFDGVTPNQTYTPPFTNVNNLDVWVNNVDPDTLAILDNGTVSNGLSGEWGQVDTTTAQNIAFNFSSNPNIYEIESLANDQIQLVFGDGNFAAIPSGTFQIWARSSTGNDTVISSGSILNVSTNFNYIDSNNLNQTLTVTFSQIADLSNGSAPEDLDHIRVSAPGTYYTQDRMVNGADYNLYLLQDPTVLKLNAINRSYAGESKYMYWFDTSDTYQNVKIFGNDLSVYYVDSVMTASTIPSNIAPLTLVTNYLTPLLSDPQMYFFRYLQIFYNGGDLSKADPARRYFTTAEMHELISKYLGAKYVPSDPVPYAPVFPVYLMYNYNTLTSSYGWTFSTKYDPSYIVEINVNNSGSNSTYILKYQATNILCNSDTTKFWNVSSSKTISYETMNALSDTMTILRINEGNSRTLATSNILPKDLVLHAVSLVPNTDDLRINPTNPTQLYLTTQDANNDLIPDDIQLSSLMNNTIVIKNAGVGTSVTTQLVDYFTASDIKIIAGAPVGTLIVDPVANSFTITFTQPVGDVTVIIYDYIYMVYSSTLGWQIQQSTYSIVSNWVNNNTKTTLYARYRGRNNLNFLWQHQSSQFHLVDPNITNIVDMFVITKGYYLQMQQWLMGYVNIEPTPPTSAELSATYDYLLTNKMISDSTVVHSGKFKILFGQYAQQQLQAQFVVIPTPYTTLTKNQIQLNVVKEIRKYFNIANWDFADTFYASDLTTSVHQAMLYDIKSIVLVPLYPTSVFGDLYEITSQTDEIFAVSIDTTDIVIASALNDINIRRS